MILIRNYHAMKQQLELCQVRLETLKEHKELVDSFLSPKTFKISDMPPNRGDQANDPFANYVYQVINIEKQIAIVKQEIKLLQKNIEKMDKVLRSIDNNLYQIFVYRYLDGLNVQTIANKTNFSTRRIYQLLNKIEKMLA